MSVRRIVWAVLALVVVVGIAVAGWVWRDDIAGAARQAVIGDQLRQDLRESERELQRERERRQQIVETAEQRLERLNALREKQAEMEKVIEDDADAESWAGRELPDGIARLLRDGAGDGDADGAGDAADGMDDVPDGNGEADEDE